MTFKSLTCALWLVVVVIAVTSSLPSEHLDDRIRRIIESDEVKGYDVATLYAADTITNEDVGQTKRDIEAHASDTSSDKRQFSFLLSSGERLRMSLRRRSVDTSSATFEEWKEDGKREIIQHNKRDCFFGGPLEGQNGYASLAMCDAELMGSVTTDKRQYEVHALPEPNDKRDADDVMRVLLTWQDIEDGDAAELMRRDLDDVVEVPEEEPELTDETQETSRRSIEDRTVTIEVADYIDRYYIEATETNTGQSSNDYFINLLILKWSAVSDVLSDVEYVTWHIKIKLIHVVIMRSHPDWYLNFNTHTIGERMSRMCVGTKPEKYDQLTLHTAQTTDRGRVGLAYITGVCRPRFRCSASRAINTNFFTELHEFGHSLGLPHENKNQNCATDTDPISGFMGGNKFHSRSCYTEIYDRTFTNHRKGCLREEYFTNAVIEF